MSNKGYREIWDNCLRVIKDNVSASSFRTWFEPILPIKVENSVLTIQVPSPFFYEYLEEQYIDILRKTLRNELGEGAKLEYSVVMQNNVAHSVPYTVKFPTKDRRELTNKPFSLPLDEKKQIKNPFIIPGIQKLEVDPQLNENNTFDNFVEGECNRLARSAGYAVASNPGKTAFNPMFIYGASGLGKTHIAQAIGIETKDKFPDKIVLYVSANKFLTQYIESNKNHTQNDFIHFYQMIDLLIIDDIHEFANKTQTQNIFFQIFNHLHQNNKQIILTSDQSPADMKGLEERLITRFKWGLQAELQIPDYETRVAILRKKAYNDGIELSDEVIEYIASNVISNVRELHGSLISLLAQSTLNQKEITLELTQKIISNLIKNTKRELTIQHIEQVVCDHFNIPVDNIKSKTRKREIVQARQVVMYFARNLTKSSLATIGAEVGGKDHATVLHACKTVNNLMDTEKHFKSYIEEIAKKLQP